MKLSKRFLSLLLCLVLLIGCMPVFTAQASLEKPTRMDVVIAHVTEGDYKAYFPDIVNVPASVCGDEAPNGKLLVAYYKNTLHAPSKASEVKSSSIQIVESLDNGLTWSAPKTFIDNNKLIEWGFATEDNPVEMRDPNFALLNDGTIVFTAWTRRYTSDNFLKVYALTSHDGGKTWSEPVLIPVQTELGFQAKRGDIAVYDDGQMLIPIYGSNNRAVSVLGKYAKETGWEWIAEYPYPTVEGAILSEVSFVAAGETTYAMDRESGRVWQSEDRGQNWVQIADEPGSIHQPGLKLLPDGTIFATWAVKNEMGRPVYAKRFYPELGWDATPTQLVFRTNEYSADIADPSGVLLNDGRLFVVYYETISKTIGGTFCEIGDFDVTELATDTQKTIVFADDFDDENYVDGAVYTNTTYFNNNLNTDATGSIATTEKEEDNGYLHIFNNHQATSKYPQIRTTKYIKGDYSVSFDFRFEKSLPVNATSGALQDIDVYTNNADGVRYRIRNSIVNGESVFNLYFSKKDVDLYSPIKLDIKPGEWYKVRYTRIKNMYYFKLWQGDKEPTAWTAKFTSEEYTDNGPLRITWLSLKTNTIGGSYVDFDNIRISRNIDMDVLDEVYAIVGVKVPLTVNFSPAQTSPSVTWSSSNTAVATVDANGVVTPLSIGETVITSKYLDISAETKVVVTADGGFSWDFEDVEIGRRPTGLGDWTNADDCHARVYLDGDRKVMRFLDRNPSKNLISIKEFDPADTVYLTFDYKFVHAGYDTETGVRSGINSFGLLNTSYYSRFGKVYFSVFENEPGVGSLMYQTLEYTRGNTANVWTDTGIKLNANQWYNFKVEMVTGSDTVKITVDNQTVEMPVYGNDTVVDRVFFTADSASKDEEFMIDNFVLRTNVLPETYSLTFAGGEGAEGSAPVIAAGTAGEKIILPSNSFTKKQYEFGGWMLSGTNKIYKAGETFTMPASDVLFTAYWKFGNADGGFAYNFEGQSEGESPIGWKNNVNRDTLHGRIYNDNGNFVLRIVDNDSATINMERAFDESTTTRVSFKYKNVSFGTGDDLFGFYNGAFSGGSPVIRLGVFDNDDGTAVVKYYKGGWKATGITGIVSGKWYDVSLELVDGSTNATIIFGDQIATVPFEGASTAVTNLWFGSGGGGPTGEVFCVDDLKLETRVTKQSFAVTYSGGEGVTGNAPTQEATEEGTTFVLPSNKFTKTNYEFVGWVYNNKIYKAGENFKMPREAVNFTALWQYARFNGEYSENFESSVVGRVPSGWSSNVSSTETLGNLVCADGDNNVAQIVDKTASTVYFYKEFGNANTSRVSFKYKQTSFGEHGNMLSLFENDFWAGYADGSLRKIRLKVKSDGTGKGTLYNYLASAGYDYAPTHITGIELDKWYDVSIEIVEGSNTATIIFGDNVLTMPIYGTGTATSTLVLSSGENGANECEFFVDDVKILTRVPKDFFSVTYAGGDGAVGTAPTQETTEEGTTFTLPENTFTKTNYKFGGWVIGNTLYQPGETYTMPGQAVTFTAYWMLDTYNGGFEDKFDNLTAGYVPSSVGWGSNSGSNDNYYGRVYSVDNGNVLRMHDNDTAVSYNLGKEFEGSSNARLSFKYRQVSFGATGNEIALFEGFYTGLSNGNYKKVRLKVAPDGNGTGTLKYFDSVSTWDFKGSEITGIELDKWYDVSIEVTEGSSTATVIFDNKIITVPVRNNSFVSTVALNTGNTADTCTFDLDDIKVETLLPRESFAVTYAGGEGATGTAPVQEDTEEGMSFVLPENTFVKQGYKFAGWLYGTDTLYKPGENFKMPNAAVTFTAYWQINTYTGGFTETFEDKTEGTTPGTGWWNNSNTDLLHGRVYNDVDNKVLRVLDGGAGTINIGRLFDESSTSRISFKFKNISYGTGCNLFGLLEGPFANYKYKLRLAVMPETDGSGTLKYYKSGWKATGITGIAPEKWYDVTIELLDGATTATVIFGEQIASVPLEGADTVVSNLWFGSGGGSSYGDTFYVDDISVKTKREPLETYYVSANGTADGDGATLETALNSFETIYKYADISVYPVVNVYVDGKVSAGVAENKEYKGLTLNILPKNTSGDEITELTTVSNLNLGELTIGKLNLSYGVVNNNAATIKNLAVDNADEVQFSQLGGSVEAISQNVGTTAEKVVFFVDSDEQIPSVNAVSADVLSIVRAPLMKNDDKTVNFAVTPTDKVSVFETYSGTDYQFGWGKVNYTCYAQNDDVIFYSNADTDYKLTIDEAGDYQLMIVGTESYKPSDSAKETYYFTTKTLTRNGNGWTESVTLPGETNDYFGTKVVLFPLSPDALGWNNDNGTGKITAITAENYAFDGIVYTAKKAHTADFANFVEPAVPEGKYFVGWMNSDGTYSEGTKSLEAGETITAQFADYDLALEADLSVIGAQIRVNEAAHDLRFISKVSKSLLNSLGIAESNYYGENVKIGTVLLPSSYLSDDIFGVGYIDTKDNMAAKVPAKKMYGSDETSVTFTAVLTGFKEVNKFYDYVARPYVEYIDKNGVTRYVYGDAYDTSVWEIADCTLKLDQSGDRPLNEYVKDSIIDIHSNIETYIQAAYDGKTVVRGGAPEFETESTGRHTDVHLAKGNYAEVTAEQFAHGKVFYNTNFGTLVREIHITGGSVNTEIGVIADARLEHIDYNGTDMYDATYMLYAQTNGVYNNERVDNSLINAAKVAGLYDTTVVAGDVIEYSADASLEFFRNNISDKFDNVINTVSDADGYNSKVVNGVMLVSIDNASGEYTQEQFENFEADVATARANGYTVLVFQNVPLATGDEADTLVKPVENFGENTSGINYYSFGNDLTSDSMYSLITTNSDIIRGIFNTYFGHNSYVEILARDSDGNVDVSAPSIPQFGMASVNCTDNSTNGGKADKGAIVKIVITPAS